MSTPRPETQPVARDAVDLLRRHVRARPDELAVDFAAGWNRLEDALTYSELDAWARGIAGQLLARFAPGSRVIIAEPPGVAFVASFFGCLYAGMIAVPVALPRRAGSDEAQRFGHVAQDSGCAAILAPAPVAERLAGFPELASLIRSRWLDRDEADAPAAEPLQPDPEQIAFLQYTSGSTGAPKGVMVRHRNIVHNAHRIMARCRLDAQSRALIWLPHFHDLGLIGGILAPLYTGFPTTLMSPMQFAKRPLEWLRLISRGGYTISGGPNFAFRLCLERFEPDELDGVDLSRWSCAFNCAEPIDPHTVRTFASTFEPWGFRAEAMYPCYGMAEATLTVSSNVGPRPLVVFDADAERLDTRGQVSPARRGARRRSLVGVGQAAPDQMIAIVHPVTLTELDEQQVGEICTADDSVTAGYWERPEESRNMFLRLPGRPFLKFLRTGDLGFIAERELFITGRLKDLIIVDGRNLHPEDLEATVRAGADVSAALGVVAFSVERANSGEAVIIVLEIERSRTVVPDQLVSQVRAALSTRHEVSASEVLLVRAGQIPRTTSGKVRRREAKALYENGAFHPAPAVGTASPDV
ncbi:MAG: Beta-ketoacyl synthase [Phenylobacterium sp.]|nr:Beta-ketoacyl synthase [Phenylobacterium sp.]